MRLLALTIVFCSALAITSVGQVASADSWLVEAEAALEEFMKEADTLSAGGKLEEALDTMLAPPGAATSLSVTSPTDPIDSNYIIRLTTVEHTSWEMAKTALRKHKRMFYSVDDSAKENAPAPEISAKDGNLILRPTSYLPNEYLLNHLINTKQSIDGVLQQWHSVIKPHLQKHGAKTTTGLLSTYSSSLSCVQFSSPSGSDAAPGNFPVAADKSFCRSIDDKLLHDQKQHPVSTQNIASWELLKDVAATSYLRHVKAGATTASPISKAVSDASEILYWLMGADDYSIGRGRLLQEAVLLDSLLEEAGEGPQWNRILPTAVLAAKERTYAFGVGSTLIPRPHPQLSGFREQLDGFDFIVPGLTIESLSVAPASKTTEQTAIEAGMFVPHQLEGFKAVVSLLEAADKKTTTASANAFIEKKITDRGNKALNPEGVKPFPFGITREEGRRLVETYMKQQWAALAASAPQQGTSVTTVASPFCAPSLLTSPKCHAHASSNGPRTGMDPFIEILTGDENRNRQITIKLEDESSLLVDASGKRIASPPFGAEMALEQLLSEVHNSRHAEMLANFPKSVSTIPAGTRQVVIGDKGVYQAYLDPRSPRYRRLVCGTYTYHKNNARAVLFHRSSAHLCDKHLLFTDKAMPADQLAKLDQDRFVVMALNTPGGEDYFNMWQKTRMILEKVEFLVRGFEERTPEEGGNNPDNQNYPSPNKEAPASPTREQKGAVQIDASDPEAAARALLPHYSGHDFVLLSGDDVCMNMPKMRQYLAEMEELFAVPTPSISSYAQLTAPKLTCAAASTTNANVAPPRIDYHRSSTTPHHIGYSHRHFISGATYIMNRQGYLNFMSSAFHTCNEKGRTFAEDVLMGWCHRDSGVVHRNAAHFGIGEDVMNCVGIDYITGMTHTIHHTYWMNEYKRRAIPRGGPITSRDSMQHHFCGPEEMMRQNRDMFEVAVE